jgi:hypothetical protein
MTTAERLLSSSRTGWRRLSVRRSRDGEHLLDGRRLLVVSPHPDDETFGCGAAIARAATTGAGVTVVVATDGRLNWPTCGPPNFATPAGTSA